jgi:hypothetical protein
MQHAMLCNQQALLFVEQPTLVLAGVATHCTALCTTAAILDAIALSRSPLVLAGDVGACEVTITRRLLCRDALVFAAAAFAAATLCVRLHCTSLAAVQQMLSATIRLWHQWSNGMPFVYTADC